MLFDQMQGESRIEECMTLDMRPKKGLVIPVED